MRCMQLEAVAHPLRLIERPNPAIRPGQVRIRVEACGVCRTDLHVVDGELPPGPLPITPGHEIVGIVDEVASDAKSVRVGDRVGVGWLASTCQTCRYCRSGAENLCDQPAFTGYTVDGGFATHAIADARFVYRLPFDQQAETLAPLLCAGLIGWRSLKAAGEAPTLGLYGFGAAAHIIIQVAKWQGRRVFAFTRSGDDPTQAFARSLGADWVGGSDQEPPDEMDAAIIFAPAGALVPQSLRWVRKGGRVVCGGIHMSDIPSFPYNLLWGERTVTSVANLTRRDGEEFLDIAAEVRPHVRATSYRLDCANEALAHLREGRLEGAAVLIP